MPEVIVRKGEPVDRALKRLKNKLDAEGILEEVRRLRAFETPTKDPSQGESQRQTGSRPSSVSILRKPLPDNAGVSQPRSHAEALPLLSVNRFVRPATASARIRRRSGTRDRCRSNWEHLSRGSSSAGC